MRECLLKAYFPIKHLADFFQLCLQFQILNPCMKLLTVNLATGDLQHAQDVEKVFFGMPFPAVLELA